MKLNFVIFTGKYQITIDAGEQIKVSVHSVRYCTQREIISFLNGYRIMWYECQWDNFLSKSQVIKVNHYRSRYSLKFWALTHTKQQAIKVPKKLLVLNHSNWKTNSLIYIKKLETRITYEPHQQTTTTTSDHNL